jgi:hypothetical protein
MPEHKRWRKGTVDSGTDFIPPDRCAQTTPGPVFWRVWFDTGSRVAFPVSGDQMLASIESSRVMASDPFVVFGYGSLIFKVSGMRFTYAKAV